jgi:dienelactone hydrolase
MAPAQSIWSQFEGAPPLTAFLPSAIWYTNAMLSPTVLRFTLAATAALAAAALRGANETEPAAPLPGYDRAAELAVEERGREARDEAVVRDITFLTVDGAKFGRTAAYVVAPKAGQPRAAVLWVHWLGEPSTTNRTEFLEEAVSLASRGVVSLLPDTMWAKPGWYRDRVLEQDYADGVGQVNALRRAIDLLQQQPGSSKVPLAIVGHDYGGMYGMIAAAEARQAKTCVFVACTSSLLDWAFFRQKPSSMEAYQQQNAPLDLKTHVARLGVPVLFQFAEHDEYVSPAKAQDLFGAGKTPKKMIVYGGAHHDMTTTAAIREDRDAWLVRELGL